MLRINVKFGDVVKVGDATFHAERTGATSLSLRVTLPGQATFSTSVPARDVIPHATIDGVVKKNRAHLAIDAPPDITVSRPNKN